MDWSNVYTITKRMGLNVSQDLDRKPVGVAYDIETDGLLDTVSKIWCLGICDVSDPHNVTTYTDYDDNYPSIAEGMSRLHSADYHVAHNGIGYDWPALIKLLGDDIGFHKQYDTMVVMPLLDPYDRNLKLSSAGERLGFPKLEYNDWEGGYTDEMRVYMERDVTITALEFQRQVSEIEARRIKDAPVNMYMAVDIEHGVAKCLAEQSRHGFRFDVKSAEELDLVLREERDDLHQKLIREFPPIIRPQKGTWCFKRRTWIRRQKAGQSGVMRVEAFYPKRDNRRQGYVADAPLTKVELSMLNPGSRDQIAQRMSQQYGWIPTEYNKSGTVAMDEETLSSLPYPAAKMVCRYLRLDKQIGMLSQGKKAWLLLHKDGYLHGRVKSCGCRTHRMSHSNPNLAQVDKDSRMRSLFIPDEGHKLVGMDADALELRLLAAYLYAVDGGKYADAVVYGDKKDGTDAHTLNMKAIGMYDRDNTKTVFYAYIYGQGDENLGLRVIADAAAAGVTKKGSARSVGKKAKSDFQSKIDGLDALLTYAAHRASTEGYVLMPDGRRVTTGARTSLNSLLQGAGAVLMKMALVIFDQILVPRYGLEGSFHYCANVHDEIQTSVEADQALVVGRALAESIELAGVELGYSVPFKGDYDIGDNWSQTH